MRLSRFFLPALTAYHDPDRPVQIALREKSLDSGTSRWKDAFSGSWRYQKRYPTRRDSPMWFSGPKP